VNCVVGTKEEKGPWSRRNPPDVGKWGTGPFLICATRKRGDQKNILGREGKKTKALKAARCGAPVCPRVFEWPEMGEKEHGGARGASSRTGGLGKVPEVVKIRARKAACFKCESR